MAKLLKIGRGKENDIIIADPSVSRRHIELFINDEGAVFITDLNSSNGTTVNGIVLTGSMILCSNDVVKLGSADPLPWTNYFDLGSEHAVEPIVDRLVVEEGIVASTNRNWIFAAIAAVVVVFLIVGGIYITNQDNNGWKKIAENTSSNNTTISDNTSTDNTTVPVNPDGDVKPTYKNRRITYDYSCMDSYMLTEASDWETELVNLSNAKVSLGEEIQVGEQLYNACKLEYIFLSGNQQNKIKNIKNKLVREIDSPRGFNYKIYLIEDNQVNAFTAGGYIFVTTGMMNFVHNDDELACVIGHEIAHNERKHINLQLKRQKVTSELFGELFAEAADALAFMVTTPFNQKKETESDFYGINYATRAGYNSCEAIKLWKRMSEQEGEFDQLDNMMRSHPYSIKRSSCCKNHINTNFDFICN